LTTLAHKSFIIISLKIVINPTMHIDHTNLQFTCWRWSAIINAISRVNLRVDIYGNLVILTSANFRQCRCTLFHCFINIGTWLLYYKCSCL